MERRSRTGSWQIACGRVPKHWVYNEALSQMANDALYFCKDRLAQRLAKSKVVSKEPLVMKVYTGYRSYRYSGKCYTRVGVICLNERRRKAKDLLSTLSHEIAHMAYSAHGPRHAELTDVIYGYLYKLGGEEKCTLTQPSDTKVTA